MDPVVADTCLSTLGFGDEHKFHRPFRRGEDMCGIVGLFACGNKPHVPRRDPDEDRHVMVTANCNRIPPCVLSDREDLDHQKGVSLDSEEASAWRTALRISSGSYSVMAIHEPAHRCRKESVIARKTSSSWKTDQYKMSLVTKQLRGLPTSSVLVRNVRPARE